KAVAKLTRAGDGARLLRLPGAALDPPADLEPDRIDVLTGAGPDRRNQGPRVTSRWARHVLQADRGGRGEVEAGQRAGARGARTRGREVREWTVGRADRSGGRRVITRFRSTTIDYSSVSTMLRYRCPLSGELRHSRGHGVM